MRDYQNLIAGCKALVERTGAILLEFWNQDQKLLIQKKSDGTPCSEADLAAHQVIIAGLQLLTPEIPVLSEEGERLDYIQRSQWRQYWLVDPLDGTRGFLDHLEQFSINIALIAEHRPVLGMIYVPRAATVYYAWEGGGAYKQVGNGAIQKIHSLNDVRTDWRVLIGQYSRGKRLAELINNRCSFQILRVNGSVKFGLLADGQADVYPRLSPISEWDTAAGQCILTESGGAVVDLRGKTLQYNRTPSLLTPAFVALADSRWTEQWLEILK